MWCEYAENRSSGIEICLWCKISDEPCLWYRFCPNDQCIKMLNTYLKCPARSDQMGRHKKEDVELKANQEFEIIYPPIEEIKEENPIKKKITKSVCNVLNKTQSKVYVDFNGSGIMLFDNNPNKTNKIEITYEGEFNTPTFSIISHKYL